MKKKKLKKMINKLKKKSERELDVEVNLLTDKINSLVTSIRRVDARTEEKIRLIDERTMALDNVKVQKTLDKTKELDDKVKILMDRTSTNYNAYSETFTTYENACKLITCMADRGATKDELDNMKDYFNKYIFKCKLFQITLEKEENSDG